jgi:menaquinol-cytochrome c reductase cytochrome b/c subunit
MSVIIHSPLLDPANPNATPNPSKAPWYFLGLQELLSYFDPQIAGVMVPAVHRDLRVHGDPLRRQEPVDPAERPQVRHHALHHLPHGSATLTIFGVLFRGGVQLHLPVA